MDEEKYVPIIGLEIHVELKTVSKMFCGCKNDPFHARDPNIYTCPVCLGLPGALPVPNRKAVEWCVMFGLALNCEIPPFSKFDRKNYFYPDLPKGYQISQYDQPFCVNGKLDIKAAFDSGNQGIKTYQKRIRIRRVHLEEDTGKLVHATVNGPISLSGLRGASEKVTLIDFNRSGVPLVEIVTEPDIRNSEEARIFLKKLHQIIRYLGISDANMEEGSMRLEPNISVKALQGSTLRDVSKGIQNAKTIKFDDYGYLAGSNLEEEELPQYKVEVKNINSFNFAKKAIDYEIDRHITLLEQGEMPKQETRGWDEKKGITVSQRSKEEAQDYRYFPEPDIPPVRWTEEQIRQLADQIPELPDNKIGRFMKDYGLSEYEATILTDDVKTAEFFEASVKDTSEVIPMGSSDGGEGRITHKVIANWIINKKADITKVTPKELIKLISQKTQMVTMDEKELETVIRKVIDTNPKAVTDYKSGKEASLMFLLGQVMRETKGKADANAATKLLSKALE